MTDVCAQPRKSKNVYGQALEPCRRPTNAADARGSWDASGPAPIGTETTPGLTRSAFVSRKTARTSPRTLGNPTGAESASGRTTACASAPTPSTRPARPRPRPSARGRRWGPRRARASAGRYRRPPCPPSTWTSGNGGTATRTRTGRDAPFGR